MTEGPIGHTALLVVHGIGAQDPGETLAKLATGLRRLDGASVPAEITDGMRATVGAREIRLYEVYWADLHKGEKARGAFDIQEAQSLSWFPRFNWRRDCYRVSSYSTLRLLWWSFALPLVNFLVVLGYYGSGFVAQIFLGPKGKRPAPERESRIGWAGRKFAGRGTTLSALDIALDEYAGDVLSYVNSAGDAFHREEKAAPVPAARQRLFADAMARFYDQLIAASAADGCTDIQIVAHSLGTVVTWHALSGFRLEADPATRAAIDAARSKISRLYTIGCPLEKIRFFWPRITPRAAAAGLHFQWDNFVSFFDPVSGRVRTFDDWGDVKNHPLLGGGFISAHVVYEGSPIFLGALGEGLCGQPVPLEGGDTQGLRNTIRLIGETLLVPVLLALVLSIGAALFVAVGLMLPWLASWVARIFVGPETYGPIVDKVSLVLLGMMLLTFAVAPRNRASRVHRRYWTGR